MFHADRQTDKQTDKQTDMAKLIAALRYFAPASNRQIIYRNVDRWVKIHLHYKVKVP